MHRPGGKLPSQAVETKPSAPSASLRLQLSSSSAVDSTEAGTGFLHSTASTTVNSEQHPSLPLIISVEWSGGGVHTRGREGIGEVGAVDGEWMENAME
ncbi:hypothetical protein [Oryza sativa Japonica Group]|uniref:Uncharacterized protein n=1 Tax=Oryza sativa subsp. japonica TaxID=39947 RepID=Q9FTV6_ORYSJ|nr:hypothetical protein [Oryza sativa Japonica Group]